MDPEDQEPVNEIFLFQYLQKEQNKLRPEQEEQNKLRPAQEEQNKPRSAFETVDDPFEGKVPLYKVGDQGIPEGKINVDLKAKDLQALWSAREPYLWFSILICCAFFLLVMGAY